MLKIDRKNQALSFLDTPTLADVSLTERYDLQEFIYNCPDTFFKELGLELFLLGKEIAPSKNVQDRIDLLAVDKEGCCVVVELKRANHKLHMLQAISYAGMISHWSSDEFLQFLGEGRQEQLVDFLEVDVEELNRAQRVVLIAEAFDYALLIGADWLSDKYGVDIMCCRISIAKDADTENEYLVCSNVYPAPELVQEAVTRGRRKSGIGKVKWDDWDSALAKVENPVVSEFFREQLAAQRESYLRKRILHYRIDGKRRWFVSARSARSYVWQKGRFDDDIEFWRRELSDGMSVKPVKDGRCLSFFLSTKEDFDFFQSAATKGLVKTKWMVG